MGPEPESLAPSAATATGVFRDFFEEHADFVWRSVRHLGGRQADVEDLVQEVFIVAHDKRAQLRDAGGARPWLYRICFGVVRNHQRRAQVRREVPTEAPEAVGDLSSTPLDPVERRDTQHALLAVLEQLDPDKRAVLVAQAIGELSMKEIADALSIPLKTAYSRLYAARREAAAAFRGSPQRVPQKGGEDEARPE